MTSQTIGRAFAGRVGATSVRLLGGVERGTSGWDAAYLPLEHHTVQTTARPHLVRRYVGPGTIGVYRHWTAALEVLGVPDPTDATGLVRQADRVVNDSREVASTLTVPDSTGDKIADAIAGAAWDGDGARRRYIDDARAEAVDLLNAAVRELHAGGDSLVTDFLVPLAADLLKRARKGDDGREPNDKWQAVHRLAGLLRSVGGATSVDQRPEVYAFARPDEVHNWRFDHADSAVESRRSVRGERTRIYFGTLGAPALTLDVIVRHADEWQPGLFTGPQVLDHATGWFTL